MSTVLSRLPIDSGVTMLASAPLYLSPVTTTLNGLLEGQEEINVLIRKVKHNEAESNSIL